MNAATIPNFLIKLTRSDWVNLELKDGAKAMILAPTVPFNELTPLQEITDPQLFWQKLELLGECALIIDRRDVPELQPDDIVLYAHTDFQRAFPLFFSRVTDPRSGGIFHADNVGFGSTPFVLSDDVYAVPHSDSVDDFAREAIKHGIVTVNGHTLFADISAFEADCELALSSAGELNVIPSFGLDTLEPDIHTDEAAKAAYDPVIREVYARFAERNQDVQIFVPLSGGADSRLQVAMLVESGLQKNTVAFTYGIKGSSEMNVSRQVAESLGVRWEGVHLDARKVRAAWQTAAGAEYLRQAWTGTSLPHIQDWYAIGQLRRQGIAQPGDIVMPGHSIVLDLHEPSLAFQDDVSPQDFTTELVSEHFSFQGKGARNLPGDSPLRKVIEDYVAARYASISDGSAATPERAKEQLIKEFNVRNRQAKYINNSVRTYEWADLRWSYPLLDANIRHVHSRFDVDVTRSRNWYLSYTEDMFRYVAKNAEEIPVLWSPLATMGKKASTLKTVLKTTGLLDAANAAHSRFTNLNHPMAFQAFAPINASEYQIAIARGQNPLGVYANALLSNSWHPDFNWQQG